MDIPLHPPRNRRAPAVTAALLALALAGPTAAQVPAGSQSNVVIARSTASVVGRTGDAAGAVELGLGQAATGPVMTSASYELDSGVVWTEPSFRTVRPVVLAVDPPTSLATSGATVTVIGMNFDFPGGGLPDVRFGGVSSPSVDVVGSSVMQVDLPSGVDAFGNPLGNAAVEVQNAIGSSQLADGFRFLPALYQLSPAQIGAAFELSLHTQPASVQLLWFGIELGGDPVPTPPYAGAAALYAMPFFVLSGAFSPTGLRKVAFSIPADPSLAGAEIGFQALGITDLVTPTGSYSNPLTLVLQP